MKKLIEGILERLGRSKLWAMAAAMFIVAKVEMDWRVALCVTAAAVAYIIWQGRVDAEKVKAEAGTSG